MRAKVAAFWSYAQADDENTGGRVLELAELVRQEYALLTGEDLNMFVDRDSIEWGEEWKSRISNALVETTFLIAVLTPKYFTRPECRKELEVFAAEARSLGMEELMGGILYTQIEDFTDANSDPLIALTTRFQVADWTGLRLAELRSAEHMQAVNKLAERLVTAGRQAAAMQQIAESQDPEEAEQEGLAEISAAIGRLLPEWREAVEYDALVEREFRAVDDALSARERKLRSGPASARFTLRLKRRQESELLLQRRAGAVAKMLATTIELAPSVSQMIRIVREHPESRDVALEFLTTIRDTIDEYPPPPTGSTKAEPVADWARRHTHEGRGFAVLAKLSDSNRAKRDEAIKMADGWRVDLADVLGVRSPVRGRGKLAANEFTATAADVDRKDEADQKTP